MERRLTGDGLLTGDAVASAAVARIVFDAVLVEPIVRVKLWTRDGRIVYSDESRLIGSEYELDEEDLEVLDEGGVVSEVSDLSGPENRFERPFGELLEVYARRDARRDPAAVRDLPARVERRRAAAGLASTFVPVLVVTLVALALLMVPIAWMLARRVRTAQLERERLMQRAIESSDRERRRIAGDLHDGPVQELAGLSMRLSASAEKVPDGAAAGVLRDSASAVRGSVRTLRSAVVGVYPPNLQQVGLAASLSDLVARLGAHGVDATVEIDPRRRSGRSRRLALPCRAGGRAQRRGARRRERVRHPVAGGGTARGARGRGRRRGIDPERAEQARGEGHVGLSILRTWWPTPAAGCS